MSTVFLLAPFFLAFEVWQLVISERYLGLKQIARNGDPRLLGLREVTAFFWSVTLFCYVAWMFALLTEPFSRLLGVCLLVTLALGFSLRRNLGLKWILVVLTFEGAVRVGLLVWLTAVVWHRL